MIIYNKPNENTCSLCRGDTWAEWS